MRNLFVNFVKFFESCKHFAKIFYTMVKKQGGI